MEKLVKGDLSAAGSLADVASKLNRIARRAGFLILIAGMAGLGCTPKFFRLSTDARAAEAGCAGTLSAELLESTGTGFEDRTVYRLHSADLPQGKEYTLQLRKADGFVTEDIEKVFVGEGGVIQSDEHGELVDVVLRFSKMLPNEPVGAGVMSSDGGCARTVVVPREKERAVSK